MGSPTPNDATVEDAELTRLVRNTAPTWARSEWRLVLIPEFTDLLTEPEAEPGADTDSGWSTRRAADA